MYWIQYYRILNVLRSNKYTHSFDFIQHIAVVYGAMDHTDVEMITNNNDQCVNGASREPCFVHSSLPVFVDIFRWDRSANAKR